MKKPNTYLLLFIVTFLSFTSFSQEVKLVKDINTTLSPVLNFSPTYITEYNSKLYFSAFDDVNGTELWESDGTVAGTKLVKDIYAGAASSSPQHLTVYNNKLYFSASDGTNGRELWESDGTVAGTKLVKDIDSGSINNQSDPKYLTVYNNKLYFQATNRGNGTGRELWESDGTLAGTKLVKDINPTGDSFSQYAIEGSAVMTVYNNKLYFSADDGTNGRELWETDGTIAGTKLSVDIYIGTGSSSPQHLTVYNNKLYFSANDGTNGYELWESDGTVAGTKLVKDINAGVDSSGPKHLTVYNNKLYFNATAGNFHDRELWVSDGTAAGTKIVKDIKAGIYGSDPQYLAVFNNKLYFSADDGTNSRELWESDGTLAGTKLAKDIYAGSRGSSPSYLTVYNGKLYFSANEGTHGVELWESDGTLTGTKLVNDFYTGTSDSDPQQITMYNNKFYFSAKDNINGTELWESDGTEAGTKLVKDINAGSGSSTPQHLTVYNNKLYFNADDGINGTELWESDGTVAGTKLVKDINGSGNSFPQYLTVYNNKLYFSAWDGTNGVELWESDGTLAGTKLVKDINGGSNSSPQYLTVFNNKLYFSANDGTNGQELWESDGTEVGTQLVKNIYTGSSNSFPSHLTVYNSKLYFRATDSSNGAELWESDGTEAGTKLVKDIYPGRDYYYSGSSARNSSPSNLTVYNSKLYFSAITYNGNELWESDGTDAGTKLVKDIRSGVNSSTPRYFAVYNNKFYFSANDGTNGIELWESDGTVAGTNLTKDIYTGSSNSSPSHLTVYNNKLYFNAYIPENGAELFYFEPSPPTITTLSAADDATGVDVSSNFVVTFNEDVVKGTGNIVIYNAADDSVVETIDVITAKVSVSGKVVTINPATDLEKSKNYYIQIAATAIKNSVDVNFAGIADKTTWSFATVLKVTATITFTDVIKTYGGPAVTLDATSNASGTISYSIVAGGTGTATLSGTNNETLTLGNAGTVKVKATQLTDANYLETEKEITITIDKAPLTVTADSGLSKVYGTTDPTLTYTITGFQGMDNEASLDTPVSISRASGENVANYVVTPASAADSNYSISFVTSTFGITPASLTITADSGLSKVYGTTDPTLTYTITGFQGADNEASLDTPVSISRASGENVANYLVTPASAADSNYSISFVTSTFGITQAALTITADSGLSKVYGSTDPTLTYTITGFLGGDNEASLDTPVSISRASGENVANYVVTPASAADTNYSVSFVTTTFAITPARLTITGLTGNNKVYDGGATGSASGVATLSGVVGMDDFTLGGSPMYTFATLNIGTGITVTTTGYTISGTAAGNYTLTQPSGLTADITAKALTVIGLTGDDKMYDGTTAATASGTPVLSGVEGVEVVTLVGAPVFTFASPNPGTAITINTTGYSISGADNGNYSLTQPTLSADIVGPSIAFTSTSSSASESVTSANLSLVLSFASPQTVTVDYAVIAGTATGSGTDYTLASGTLTFFPGSTSENIVASIVNEAMVETNETFILQLSNPVNGTIGTNTSHTYTINNDDSAAVTIADISGNENDGAITVTATLDNPVQGGFTVDVSTVDGTATIADSDFTGVTSQTLTFAGTVGETQTFTVTPTGDTKVEADETFTITQGNLAGTSLSADIDITDGATGTINNDDTASVTIADVSVNEGDGARIMTLTLDNAVQGGFSVDVSTLDGTALASDVDYATIVSETVTFAGTAGETQTVIVAIGENSNVEADETFTLFMDNLTPVSAPSSAINITDSGTITIIDNDSATLTVDNVSRDENADGATSAFTFTVTLTGNVDTRFSIDYGTQDVDAVAGVDYVAKTGQLNFAGTNGETQQFTITVNDDEIVESDEIFAVGFANLQAGGRTITLPTPALGTIVNNDTAIITLGDVSGNEDDGAITMIATLSNAVQEGFSVDVSTVDGTATTADSDYTGITSQTISFTGAAGETQTFTVTPTADNKVETDETLVVSMGAATTSLAASITTTGTATVTITNDDTSAVTIADISANEDDGSITVTAALDNAVQGGFTVDVSTADGTATLADADYTAVTSETLTFLGTAGETQTFTITPAADTTLEADETIIVTQSNVSATSLSADIDITDGATVTINNDDTAAVTIADISANEDDGTITVTASLDNAVDGGFTVDVSTIDGTASTADSDYTAVISETLTFAGTAGETQTFTITPSADTTLEANETLTIVQSNLSATTLGVVITDGATVTILNDDSASVMIANVSGDEADGVITVTATLDNPVQGGFTVDVSTSDETATLGGGDYDAILSQTLTFSGTTGETQTFTVTPIDDTTVETDETFTISQGNLSATSLGVVITDGAIVTINNDDSTTISIEDITVVEADGVANITATLTNPVQGGFVLNITTADGTAVATSDYTAFADTAGATFVGTADETQTIAIPITDDMIGESTEGFTVTLTSVSGTTVGGNITTTDSVIVTIIDDDAPVVSAVSVPADGNYGIGDHLDFTVTFTNAATTTGAPSIPVIIGTTTVQALLNGAVTESLTADFRYTVVESDLDTDGIALGAAINLNGGTIVGITSIPAILDLNNIGNTSDVNVDGIRPTVVVSSTVPDPTNAAFMVTFTFSEDVIGFDAVDITVGNGTAGVVTPVSTTVYTAMITPTADGIVTVELAAGVAQDTATNGNDASNQFSVLYDATNPTAVMSTLVPDPVNTPFTVDIVFDEDVFGFEMTDLVVTNGTPSAFTGSGTTYSVLITPTASDDVIVEIPAGVTQDLATNPNDGASFTIEFDNTPPNPPQITNISDYTCSTDVSQTGDNTLEISGTAERGSTVEVFIEGISVGTTISDINTGFFTFDHTGTVLADGSYTITAQATDIAMNTGALSNPFAITINTVDSDGDGIADFCDDDDDGDGVDDVDQDCDNDGIIDSLDTDNSSCFAAIAQVKTYGFSPNGDGVNDGWVIEGITAYPNSLVQVFNRSGKPVFKKKGYQNDWDGISNQINSSGAGNRLPVGPYIFIIDLGDGSQPTRGWLYINY